MKNIFFLLSFLVFGFKNISAQQKKSYNNISDWKTTVGTIEEKDFMGRKALFLSKGLAYLPAENFANGIIEVDIAPTQPGLAGITFHGDDSLNYENIYIRNIKSGGADALQYNPEFKAELSWQFYPEYQATFTFPKDWIHLKIVIENKRAAVYVAGSDTAVMTIDSLRIPNASGYVGLWALTGSYFSNFSFTPSSSANILSGLNFPNKIIRNPLAIQQYWMSEPATFTEGGVDKFTTEISNNLKWQKVFTDPDGFVNINKYAHKKTGGNTLLNSNDFVWLRYEFEEKKAGNVPFSFEFSNRCFVFINAAKVFAGNNSFQLKGPFYRGDIDKQLQANTIYLPVKKGWNTLVAAVSGITNGWGLISSIGENK